MSIYSITISHPERDEWKIYCPEDVTVEEALDALTIHVCHLAQVTGLETDKIIEEVRRTIEDQSIHIHQDLDQSDTF
jgi:hypothetical protein